MDRTDIKGSWVKINDECNHKPHFFQVKEGVVVTKIIKGNLNCNSICGKVSIQIFSELCEENHPDDSGNNCLDCQSAITALLEG